MLKFQNRASFKIFDTLYQGFPNVFRDRARYTPP